VLVIVSNEYVVTLVCYLLNYVFAATISVALQNYLSLHFIHIPLSEAKATWIYPSWYLSRGLGSSNGIGQIIEVTACQPHFVLRWACRCVHVPVYL